MTLTRYSPRFGDQCISCDDGLLVLAEDAEAEIARVQATNDALLRLCRELLNQNGGPCPSLEYNIANEIALSAKSDEIEDDYVMVTMETFLALEAEVKRLEAVRERRDPRP